MLTTVLRNGATLRALSLAVATVVLLAIHRPTLIPFSVSAYAIANAYAVTSNTVKSARRRVEMPAVTLTAGTLK